MTKWKYFIAGIIAISVWVGCRSLANSESETLADSQTPQSENAPESDLPSTGQSLFDYVIASNGGQVPYPFSSLLALVNNTAESRLASAIFPFGRSLQRYGAQPEFFKFPRLVIGVGKGFPSRVSNWQLDSRLFVGFLEPAKQLEIISYNEAAGRFEFQVVEDYAPPPAIPKIYYARRQVCTACHQGKAPLFPSTPWNETTNPAGVVSPQGSPLGAIVSQELSHAQFYQGIPLGIPQPGSPSVVTNDTPLLDEAAGRANTLLYLQTFWTRGCGDGPEGVKCRGYFLELSIQNKLLDGSDERALSLFNFFRAKIPQAFPGGIPFSSPVLDDVNPISEALGEVPNFPVPVPAAFIANLKTKFTDRPIAPQRDPLANRKLAFLDPSQSMGELSLLTNEFASLLLEDTVVGQIQAAYREEPGGVAKLDQAIDRLIAETISGENDVLINKPFQRVHVVNNVFEALGSNSRVAGCCANLPVPAPKLEPVVSTMPPLDNPSIRLFGRYCGGCHGTNSVPGNLRFMAATNETLVRVNLKLMGSRIIKVLDWENNNDSSMPPDDTEQYTALAQSNSDRMEMLQLVRSLVSTPQ